MKRVNDWTHNFSQKVDGLEYSYPFNVNDYVVVTFTSQSDEISKLSEKFIMKVIQIGVPIQKVEQSFHLDVLGDLISDGIQKGNIVEGVRVQMLYFKDGIYEDAGHGYKENLPVSILRRVNRPENIITKTFSPKLNKESLKLFEKAKYERKKNKYGWTD